MDFEFCEFWGSIGYEPGLKAILYLWFSGSGQLWRVHSKYIFLICMFRPRVILNVHEFGTWTYLLDSAEVLELSGLPCMLISSAVFSAGLVGTDLMRNTGSIRIR